MKLTTTKEHTMTAYLIDYATGRTLRKATTDEQEASEKQVEMDGIGIILVDGRECITESDLTF
jgi:hypothetical protein